MQFKFIAGMVIVLFFSLLVSQESFAASKNLSVENYSQERSNWCWVTAGQIIHRYLDGNYFTQCTLYRAGKNVSACANNTGGFYADMARVLSHGSVHVGLVTANLVPMYTITSEIDKNRPLLVRIGWKSNPANGHMLVLRGYNTNGNYVRYVYPKQSSNDTDRTSEFRSST